MNALAIAIVCCAIQVTVFALMAAIVYLAARRQAPDLGARVALAGLLGVALLTAVLWSPWPNWVGGAAPGTTSDSLAQATDASARPFADETPGSRESTTADPSPNSRLEQAATSSWGDFVRAAWNNLQQEPSIEDAAGPITGARTWQRVAGLVFLATATVGLLRLIGGLIGAMLLRRQSLPLDDIELSALVDQLRAELGCKRRVELHECAQLATAATIGWRRPLVLLPINWHGWTRSELRAVLAHEIAHIQRADFATHSLAQVGLALHFYHPLLHWLAGRLRLEQELAADAAAARVAGGERSYLTSLAGLALAQSAIRPAWPVHAFLPTRRTFIRRIEMLRDRTMNSAAGASPARQVTASWLTVVVLCAAGLVAAGLRAPTAAHAQRAPATANNQESTDETPGATAANAGTKYDFSYVPENFLGLVAIRPSELATDPRLEPLAKLLEENTRPGVPSKLVEQTSLLFVAPDFDARGMVEPGTGGEQVIFHTTEAVDFATYLKKGYPTLTTTEDEGHELWVISPHPGTMSFFAPDKQTLIGRVRTGLLKLLDRDDANEAPAGADAWQSEANGQLLIVARGAAIGAMLAPPDQRPADMMLSTLMPLLQSADLLVLSADAGEQFKIQGRAICKSTEEAATAAETLGALAVLAGNMINAQREQLAQGAPAQRDALNALLDMAETLVKNRQVTVEGKEIRLETSLGETEGAVRLFVDKIAPAIQNARDAARTSGGLNNLKQIALAMLNYESANKHFPPAVLYGPDGKTPHSWRIAILPYIEEQELYKQYRFDEPWDSENNRKVLDEMPDVYRHPKDAPGSTNTSYFVLTGPDTAFSGKEGTEFRQISDGTSRTLLAVEAKRDIPWTKPEDIPYAADKPLPELGGWFENVFLAALCDGSARAIPSDQIDEKTLRAMITKDDGETIDWPR